MKSQKSHSDCPHHDDDAKRHAHFSQLLRRNGLRPTRQRIALARLLLGGRKEHVTAEALYKRTQRHGLGLTLATVYNCLHQFVGAGLLREVSFEGRRICYDTNLLDHAHLFDIDTGELTDLAPDEFKLDPAALPDFGDDKELVNASVVFRVRAKKAGVESVS